MKTNQQRTRFPRKLIILWLGIVAMGAISEAPFLGGLFLVALLYVVFMDKINAWIAGQAGKGHQVSDIEYQAYAAVIEGYKDTPTAYIAEQTGLSEKKVVQDLMALVERRQFPGAYFDEAGNFIVPSNKKVRDTVPKVKAEDKIRCPYCSNAIPAGLNYCYYCGRDLAIIADVEHQRKDSLERMDAASEGLSEDAVKEMIQRIRDLTDQILKKYEEEPRLLRSSSKFREYYLPKTIEAMEYYQKLDTSEDLSNRQEDLRAQIEDSLVSIEEAFRNILQQLTSVGADDLAADVSALESVLTQDGLVETAFETQDA